MHTLAHRHTHTHEQRAQKTRTQKSSPIPCARVLLVISNYLCLLSLFHSLRTQQKDLKSFSFFKRKKKNGCHSVKSAKPGKEERKATELKALIDKTTATRRIKSKYCYRRRRRRRRIRKVCAGGEHTNDNNVIDTMKTNESL